MINNSAEGKDFYQAKQEGDTEKDKLPKTTTSSSSRQWAGFKNPRIVRVSRSFGGKDRHSKVCTVKGLRDRRIRLSVPTAIQLYDLQDRLGLSQPSKVIDWLLDATKDDIDTLPPLPIPMEDFTQFHLQPAALVPHDLNSPHLSFSPFFTTPNGASQTLLSTKPAGSLKLDDDYRDSVRKGKEAIFENKWNEPQEDRNGNGNGNEGLNFFPIPQSSYSGLIPYNSYVNLEPSSNLSLSQFGNQGLVSSSQMDITSHNNSHPASLLSSPLALPSPSPFFLCPPVAPTASFFPPYFLQASGGSSNDPTRQVNNFQFLSSNPQQVLTNPVVPPLNVIDAHQKVPFGLHANSKFYSQSNIDDSRWPEKGKE